MLLSSNADELIIFDKDLILSVCENAKWINNVAMKHAS